MYSHRTVGEIMAISLAHGGPAPAFLKEVLQLPLHGRIFPAHQQGEPV